MIDEDYRKEFHPYVTTYDKYNDGLSLQDQSQKALDELYTVHLSEPLKKMQIDYLTSAKACYKEKHLDDSMPNFEQIQLCKELE
jgi:hypothetical protein